GARRRRTRAGAVGLAAAVVVAGSAFLVVPGVTGSGADQLRGVAGRPAGLSPLQKRVMREVDGAERLSVWQVAVPEPEGAAESFPMSSDDFEVQG
ncbi:hypothetical protein NLU14_21520, partial [Marinobacter sp. 71-i]